jgi:hypothetical protein
MSDEWPADDAGQRAQHEECKQSHAWRSFSVAVFVLHIVFHLAPAVITLIDGMYIFGAGVIAAEAGTLIAGEVIPGANGNNLRAEVFAIRGSNR